jgi:protease-4
MDPAGGKENWERQVIEKLARAALDEQRKSRNWGIFFKTLTFIYLFAGWLGGREPLPGDHTALVELNGVIAADTHANADVISQGLQDAFENKGTKGVILRINSP